MSIMHDPDGSYDHSAIIMAGPTFTGTTEEIHF